MRREFEIPIKIGLDAVIYRSLKKPRYGRGFIEFERWQVGEELIFYSLKADGLGNVGEIELRREQDSTWLGLSDAEEPKVRQYTDEELARLRQANSRDEKLCLIKEFDAARKKEQQELYQKRKEHFEILIDWLEYCINADLGHVLLMASQPRADEGDRLGMRRLTKDERFEQLRQAFPNPKDTQKRVIDKMVIIWEEWEKSPSLTPDDLYNRIETWYLEIGGIENFRRLAKRLLSAGVFSKTV